MLPLYFTVNEVPAPVIPSFAATVTLFVEPSYVAFEGVNCKLSAVRVPLPTVKLRSKLADMPFAPLTVTVAAYVPAASPVFGATVKDSLPFTTMPATVGLDRVKLLPSAPFNAMSSAPVGWLPVLFIVTLYAVWLP